MKTILTMIFFALMGASIFVWSDITKTGGTSAPIGSKPDILSAGNLTPMVKPSEIQKVAIMKMTLTPNGKKVGAKINSKKIIKGYGPKAFSRSGGTWKVKILGERSASYYINNPLTDIEVEKDPKKGTFQLVEVQKPMDWTLVVPLYKDGQALNAKTIEVHDMVSKQKIIHTQLGSIH